MKLQEMYKVNFKSKKDDRGDYCFCVTAKNGDKAMSKVLDKIYKNKEELTSLTSDYYMLYDDIFDLSRKMHEATDEELKRYCFAHLPSVRFIGFSI